jgi:hypothetical protein
MSTHKRGAGISNRMSPEDEARDAREHPPLEPVEPPPEEAAGRVEDESAEAAPGLQTSLKSGIRSTAQKEAGTRHQDEPAPPSRKVSGAFGRERRENE